MTDRMNLTIDGEINEKALGLFEAFGAGGDMSLYECYRLAIALKQKEIIQEGFEKIINSYDRSLKQ